MRAIGIDVGGRRVGVAVSDASGTLASPFGVLEGGGVAVARVVELIERLAAEDDGLAAVVVGLPCRLDGSPNEQTARVRAFVKALRGRVPQPIVLQDERLTSVEAESRLALRDRDWRSRKKKLDAAAAAVILQDYLDGRAALAPPADGPPASDEHLPKMTATAAEGAAPASNADAAPPCDARPPVENPQ